MFTSVYMFIMLMNNLIVNISHYSHTGNTLKEESNFNNKLYLQTKITSQGSFTIIYV